MAKVLRIFIKNKILSIFYIKILFYSILFEQSNCLSVSETEIIDFVHIYKSKNRDSFAATNIVKSSVDYFLGYVIHNENFTINLTTISVQSIQKFITDDRNKIDILLDTSRSHLLERSSSYYLYPKLITKLNISTYGVATGDESVWKDQDNGFQFIKNDHFEISLPSDTTVQLVVALQRVLMFENAAILYDDEFAINVIDTRLLINTKVRHKIGQIQRNKTAIRDLIFTMRNHDLYHYFIIGLRSTIQFVLESVDKLYFGDNFLWTIINLSDIETENMKAFRCKCTQRTKMFYVHPKRAELSEYSSPFVLKSYPKEFPIDRSIDIPDINRAFYFDLTGKIIEDLLIKKSSNQSLRSNIYGEYILPNGNNSLTDAYQKFQMLIKILKFDRSGYVLLSKVKLFGYWISGYPGEITTLNKSYIQDMTATTIYRVYTVVQPPFIIRAPFSRHKYIGYCIDLLDKIANQLNFDYEVIEIVDGKYGSLNEAGHWNGIIRKLIDKEADIGLGAISVMADRESVVDFTVPYYDLVGISIMIKKFGGDNSFFKFLTVMETNVWICIIGAYFITSLLMFILDRWSPYSYQNNKEKYIKDPEKRVFNFKECLWFCVTSLTPQGGGYPPKCASAKLVAATWWLFGFIIVASYTANLAAFFTINRLDTTALDTLVELAAQYRIQYSPVNGSEEMTFFKRMADIESQFYHIWKNLALNDSLSPVERSKYAVWEYPVSDKYTRIWEAIQLSRPPNSIDEAVARVQNSTSISGFAYIGEANIIKYLVSTHCDLLQIGEEFSRKPYAIALQQGSLLKDSFDKVIIDLIISSELEQLKRDWWPENKGCANETPFDGVSITNIAGFFLVIVVGIILACITLIYEYFSFRKVKKSKVVPLDGRSLYPIPKVLNPNLRLRRFSYI